MGLFEYLNNKIEGKKMKWANTMLGYTPSFSQFGNNIMKDDTVKTITNRILNEYSKLNPRHIRVYNGKIVKVSNQNINHVLDNPNRLMTKSDFLRKCAWLRETYRNCFIYPTYDLYYNEKTGQTKKIYKALYPLHVSKVDFFEDEITGHLYVDFTFPKGHHSGYLLYNDVIHWRKDYGENEYMGGDVNGFPDNSSLLKYLETNDKLIQSTFKSIEGSLKINGIIKVGGLLQKTEREEIRLNFENQLENGNSGFYTLDTGADYVPIPYYGRQVSDNILKFFDKKIRNHYGVSEALLDGDYTNEQKEAFYETVIEDGVISLGQAMSRVLLTAGERTNGNEIICYTSKVQMMSADKKRDLATLLLPIGGVTANTILSWYGEPPIEGGDEPMMSLNWIKKSIADEYQLEVYKNKNASNSVKKDENISNYDIIKSEENTEVQ